MIEAQLFDGTVLQFPDHTAPEVIESTAKRLTLERQRSGSTTAQPSQTPAPTTTPEFPVSHQPSEPAEPTDRYANLLGGSEAKIQRPPGFWRTLVSEFAAPYLEAGQRAMEGNPQTGGERIAGDLRVLASPFTAIQRHTAGKAQEHLEMDPKAAEVIGDAASFAAGLVPPIRLTKGVIDAARQRAIAIAQQRAQAARAVKDGALKDARVATVADAMTTPGPALEPPEIVGHRARQADLEAAFESQLREEAERNLRQSPRSRDLLTEDLRSRQAIEAAGPVDERALAIELNERDALRRSPREAELLRRRLATEEQRSQRLASEALPEPQVPPTPPPPVREVGPAPRIVEPVTPRPKGPSIEKPFSGYLSDLKISVDKTLPQDRGELLALIESPLGKRAVVNDARPGSVSLQQAVERAFEDGFIPEESFAAFKDALDRTLAGQRVYSTKSQVFGRISKAQQTKLDRQTVAAEAERHIDTITDTPADLQFKGKIYTSAVRQPDGSVRLKDRPDKVLKRDTDVLQVEEKIPFDVPRETPEPAPDRLNATEVFEKIRRQQDPKHFNEAQISRQIARGGDHYVKAEVDPALLKIRNEKSVNPSLAAPDKGPIVVDRAGNVIDGRHRALAARERGETIEAYVPEPKPKPSFERTPAGMQSVIPGAEGRTIPDAPLRPRRPQTDRPLELEQPGLRAQEPELFTDRPRRPVPESELSPEEIAARDEMRELLGGSPSETMGQQASLDLRIGNRSVLDVLKNERGQISLGKDLDEAALLAAEEARRFVSKKRLFAGRTVEQSTNTLRKTMGEEGEDLANRLFAIRNEAEIDTGIATQPLQDAIKKLDRAKEWGNFVDVLDKGAKPMNGKIAETATMARRILDEIAERAVQAKLEIRNPMGRWDVKQDKWVAETYPFQPRRNFFPHYLNRELSDVIKTPDGRAKVKAAIKEKMMRERSVPFEGESPIPGLEDFAKSAREPTDREVELALRAMVKASKQRYGHLEIARAIDLGEYSKDPRLLLKYINDAYRRIHIAEKLGPKLETAEEILAAIGAKYGDDAEDFARTLTNRVTGMEPVADTGMKRAIGIARNYEVMTKLGRAVIPNMSQHGYTVIIAGGKNFAKGMRAAFTKEGQDFARRAYVTGDSAIREFMTEVTGMAEAPLQRGAERTLRWTGFTAVERGNRLVAANAGRHFARETFESLVNNPVGGKAKRYETTLKKMGVDVDRALKRGALSERDELKAAQSIVNRTQFKVDPLELPLFWSSPEGKLLAQFKTFNFKSGQFMKNEILKEIRRGNVAPFARAIAVLPFAGMAVKKIQNALKPNARTDDEGIADYLAAVGVFGMFADFMTDAGRFGTSFVPGPFLSDVMAATKAGAAAGEGKFKALARFLARQVPVLGPTLTGLMAKPESARVRLLREAGIYDEVKRAERLRAEMRRESRR